MQTFKITDTYALAKLQNAYYQFKAVEELYNAAKADINPMTEKWENYMLKTKNEFQHQYETIVSKIAYENAPYDNYTYCINIYDGVINYHES